MSERVDVRAAYVAWFGSVAAVPVGAHRPLEWSEWWCAFSEAQRVSAVKSADLGSWLGLWLLGAGASDADGAVVRAALDRTDEIAALPLAPRTVALQMLNAGLCRRVEADIAAGGGM